MTSDLLKDRHMVWRGDQVTGNVVSGVKGGSGFKSSRWSKGFLMEMDK